MHPALTPAAAERRRLIDAARDALAAARVADKADDNAAMQGHLRRAHDAYLAADDSGMARWCERFMLASADV